MQGLGFHARGDISEELVQQRGLEVVGVVIDHLRGGEGSRFF